MTDFLLATEVIRGQGGMACVMGLCSLLHPADLLGVCL